MGPEVVIPGNSDPAITSDIEQAGHGLQQTVQTGSNPSNSVAPRKGERSRSGCITCRARKVKCDERPRSCMNCARRGLSCGGYSWGPTPKSNKVHLYAQTDLTTEAGLERRRLRGSCNSCRSCKTKCSGGKPTCERCLRKGLPCNYRSRARQIDGISSPQGSRGSSFPEDGEELESSTSLAVDDQIPTPNGGSLDIREAGLPSWPSFMERLDQEPATTHMNGPLLHVICALGAKFYALETLNYEKEIDPKNVLASGSQWADIAQRQIFGNMNNISVENLMATVLLYDHELRVGNYSGAFMISGAATRMLQALQINLEYSTDILCTEPSNMPFCVRESRRRLMWGCYVVDSWVGSGVDQLTLIADCDVKVQLPCHERNFVQQIPNVTETLTRGQVLKFIPRELRPLDPTMNMGIAAYFARITGIRKKILRYIKQVDLTQQLQLPDAEFSSLDASCEDWLNSLPPSLRLTTASIYTRKDSSQLGALFLLHCAYHITLCDLYRISMPALLPGLLRTRLSVPFTSDQQAFRAMYQRKCFEHSKDAARILMKAVGHGAKFLADTWLCTCAFESTRTMLYYSVQGVDRSQGNSRELLSEIVPLFQANMKAMRLMIPMFATAERCYAAATSLIRKAGIAPQLVEGARDTDERLSSTDIERPVDYASPPGETPENVLNPLSIYALTRQNIDENESVESRNSLYSARVADTIQMPAVPNKPFRQRAQRSSPTVPQQQFPPSASQTHYNAASDEFMPNMALMWEQQDLGANIDSFWPGFMPDLDGLWLPADTAQENMSAMGMPTWVPGLPGETLEGGFVTHGGPVRPTPDRSSTFL
ncbi:hypothetical protein V492_00691 [Pseudogymnoascus sp. VKM F-4246]|nr:hypothetical protein V492_00691 [Pseudogymnoascus sp. VKM F-4246]